MDVVRATSGDRPAVQAVSVDAALPLDGAQAAFSTGMITRDGGRLIGPWCRIDGELVSAQSRWLRP